jgi:hypothetical protein
MNFQTIAILTDGRVAVSFLDSTTHYPSPTDRRGPVARGDPDRAGLAFVS